MLEFGGICACENLNRRKYIHKKQLPRPITCQVEVAEYSKTNKPGKKDNVEKKIEGMGRG